MNISPCQYRGEEGAEPLRKEGLGESDVCLFTFGYGVALRICIFASVEHRGWKKNKLAKWEKYQHLEPYYDNNVLFLALT